MCGISLIFSQSMNLDDVKHRLSLMELSQIHRGPDDQGVLVEQIGSGFVGIGQQRLSILDLTAAGRQPMSSPCGRYTLSYNGEVYNYKEIAAELGSDPILSASSGDTVVVLAALMRWGREAFPRFNGMWSIALLDRHTGNLLLSRDRLGVKPLHYTIHKGTLTVASEFKAVVAGSGDRRFSLNIDVISRFLIQSLNNANCDTYFDGVYELPPASYAEVNLFDRDIRIEPKLFWCHPFERNEDVRLPPTVEEVREIFIDAVRLRLRSDVPVGVMLSGGIDSSSILAVAANVLQHQDMEALSVVSQDPAVSEERFVDLMASTTGCRLRKLQSDDDPHKLWNELPTTIRALDTPVSSFSNVAHRNIIGIGRDNGLVVLLSGQGADEQLGGYNKYLYFYIIDRMRRGDLKSSASMIFGCLKNGTILQEFTFAHAKRYIPSLLGSLSQTWMGSALKNGQLLNVGLGSSYEEREWRDIRELSLPSLLASEDRMSMSRSCEMRTPFLDYRLVEAFARIPPESKLRNGWTKHIFRQAMVGILPDEIAWRKDKKGYTLPGGKWMATDLKDEIAEFMNDPMLAAEMGLIDQNGARSMYQALIDKRPGIRYQDVLSIISLEIWLRQNSSRIEN
jgi:asparagine synthase (glutamine-hydrolysing)